MSDSLSSLFTKRAKRANRSFALTKQAILTKNQRENSKPLSSDTQKCLFQKKKHYLIILVYGFKIQN